MFLKHKILHLKHFHDERGSFVKTFQKSNINNLGIDFELKESFYSISNKNVIRGMHFQLPPYQHSKIVFCTHGSILDVIIDLRKESPTFKQYFSQILSAENHLGYFIPEGYAHGFKALTDGACTYYLVSSEHHAESDTGIQYNSFGMDWGTENHLVSTRDLSFPLLNDFKSPF